MNTHSNFTSSRLLVCTLFWYFQSQFGESYPGATPTAATVYLTTPEVNPWFCTGGGEVWVSGEFLGVLWLRNKAVVKSSTIGLFSQYSISENFQYKQWPVACIIDSIGSLFVCKENVETQLGKL